MGRGFFVGFFRAGGRSEDRAMEEERNGMWRGWGGTEVPRCDMGARGDGGGKGMRNFRREGAGGLTGGNGWGMVEFDAGGHRWWRMASDNLFLQLLQMDRQGGT